MVQSTIDPVALVVQAIRHPVTTGGGGTLRSPIKAAIDAVTTIVQAIVDSITLSVEALLNSVASIIQTITCLVAFVCPDRAAEQCDTGNKH
jgi:phage-related protein